VFDGISEWTDIVGATTMNFVPTTTEIGFELRVVITYTDDFGTLETVISDPSLPVINLNDPATGTVLISDTTPTEGQLLTTTNAIVDTDGLVGVVFNYQWEQFDGLDWNPILGANASSFLPTQTQVNHELRVVVSFIDNGGAIETITSDPTIVTGDFIVGLNVAEVLSGTEGQDIINGNGGADIIDGLGQNDILDGGAGDDIINGGAGDDVINGGADDDIINGDAGNDTINFTLGDEDDTIDGGADTDTLNFVGGAGNETLNVIYDGASITEFQNGTVANVEVLNANLGGGVDTLSYNPPGGRITTANVAVNLALGTATGFASIVGIENATGGSGNDTFAGNTSANTFDGGNGNDTFTGDLGNDTLIGGLGVDTYNLSATAAAATITSTSATSAAIGNDTLSGIENINGSSVADTITMGAGNNVINGNGGGDIINGGAGADIINGDGGNDTINYNVGDGADTVNGGAGANDRLNIIGSAAGETIGVVFNGVSISSVAGGAISNVEIVNIDLAGGNDTLSFAASTANVTANLTTGVGSGIALLAGIENLTGGTGDDTFTGNTFANVLNGGGGNDRFVATVNDGDDTYTGGAGTDTLDLSGTTAGASVTAGAATSAQIGNDTLNAIENVIGSQGNDIINFGGGANVIDGRGGADTINAGGGADTITGGAGNDTMNGGAGNDTFIFATGFGLDTIQGFDALPGGGGQDRLFLDSSLGINAGNFALSVSIAGLAGNTVITIGAEQITLLGVAAATVDINDFQFGP
jgi:Ca2+-binding RTX toxin-like protein